MLSRGTFREERIDSSEREISVRIYGTGAPVLALHGYSDSGYSFVRLAEHMHGYCLIAPDFRGHGKSENRFTSFSIEKLADDAEAVINALKIDNPLVVGHSMGAMAAISLAARRRVRALATLGGALVVPEATATTLRKFVSELLEQNRGAPDAFSNWHRCERPLPEAFVKQIAQEALLLTPETWKAGLAAIVTADLTAQAKIILDPSLVLYGSKDQFFNPAVQHALANALRAIERIELVDVGHNPHWESPEIVAMHLRNFFQHE